MIESFEVFEGIAETWKMPVTKAVKVVIYM